MQVGSNKLLYHCLALATVGVWGVTFVSTKMLIHAGLSPLVIFLCRFILAYIGIWLLILFRRRGAVLFASSLKDESVMLLLGVTGGSMYFLLENTALEYTQACNVSFLVSSAPLMTILLTCLARKKGKGRLSGGQEKVGWSPFLVCGTVLALSGMAAVVFNGTRLELSPKGDFLALGAALCWGLYSMLMGMVTSEYDTLFITRKVFFYGLVTILPFFVFTPLPDASVFLEASVIPNLLFLGIVASLLCFVVWNKVMAELGNVTSTNYVYLNPFFTLIFAIVLLGESLTLLSAIGCAAIVLGVALAGKHS